MAGCHVFAALEDSATGFYSIIGFQPDMSILEWKLGMLVITLGTMEFPQVRSPPEDRFPHCVSLGDSSSEQPFRADMDTLLIGLLDMSVGC